MKPTLADYEKAIDGFAERVGSLGDDALAVYLFGSMARDEAIAGYSDLDFWIFLKTAVFANESAFKQALKTIIAAHQHLAESGIPVSNAGCYYSQDRVESLPAMLTPNLRSERASRLVFGQDIREQMKTAPFSRHLHRASTFFEMRHQLYHPLTSYLKRQSLNEKERWQLFTGLQYIKYVPEAACAALDLWPGEHGSATALTAALPDVDLGIVGRVKSFCAQEGPMAELPLLQEKLRETLAFIERLNDRIS
ncbi:MAG: nucleotidyltransferase domain-containing protein [Chloroflexi bacterium]|nr:nucleotidyltransferase domain-containing protein [Chloroflexota bacterium]